MSAERVTHVLLVEDDAVDVMNVRRAFARNNIASPLFVAAGAEEALALLRSADFPKTRVIVLLDINMPKMNGIEFLRALRGDPALRATPVVVLTTSKDERDLAAAYDLNVAGFLVKPVTSARFVDLAATLNQYWSLMEMP